MFRVMNVNPSGDYAWRKYPISTRQHKDNRLLGLIKQFWLESGSVYGYRKITDDLKDIGERCGKHRVYRLMRNEGLRSQTGYRRRPGGDIAAHLLLSRTMLLSNLISPSLTRCG